MKVRNENSSFRYRFLDDTSTSVLHETFCEAFSDYVVDFQITLDQFRKHVLLNGVDLKRSVGCFVDEKLVGFTLNGFGEWHGKSTVYDAGTGVIPTFRRQGIVKKMFHKMLPEFKKQGVEQCLLEVITNNEKALNLYRKLGFRETRELQFLKVNGSLKMPPDLLEAVECQEITQPDWDLLQTFGGGNPSWQNSVEAIKRSYESKHIIQASIDGKCVGYVVFSGNFGRIAHIAVEKSLRNHGIASRLLLETQKRTKEGYDLQIINVDSSLTKTMNFLYNRGFEEVLSQYEMLKTL
jgi:ribosomal protein S18 acetylase RimI-like enzyme